MNPKSKRGRPTNMWKREIATYINNMRGTWMELQDIAKILVGCGPVNMCSTPL